MVYCINLHGYNEQMFKDPIEFITTELGWTQFAGSKRLQDIKTTAVNKVCLNS